MIFKYNIYLHWSLSYLSIALGHFTVKELLQFPSEKTIQIIIFTVQRFLVFLSITVFLFIFCHLENLMAPFKEYGSISDYRKYIRSACNVLPEVNSRNTYCSEVYFLLIVLIVLRTIRPLKIC